MVKQFYWNASATIQKEKLKFVTQSDGKWPRLVKSGKEQDTSVKRDYFMLPAPSRISENLLRIIKYAHSIFTDKS